MQQRKRGNRRAHPRSRGEHLKETGIPVDISGSSPLARGTLTIGEFKDLIAGLIPARAGNTVFRE